MSSLRDDATQSDVSAGGSAPGLPVNAVAGRLGVAPATLRTWDRRYGLGASQHAAGEHRRYTEDDVSRLIVMRRLALDGMAPADAARAALATDLSTVSRAELEADLRRVLAGQAAAERDDHRDSRAAHRAEGSEETSSADRSARGPGRDATESDEDAPPAGARVLRIAPPASSLVRSPSAVVEAVLAQDEALCADLLHLGVDDDPARWWEDLVAPTLRSMAHRTVLAAPGEAPELMLVDVAMAAVAGYLAGLQQRAARQGRPLAHPSRSGNMVLVFLAPGDAHPLPAHALAAALAGHDVATRIVTGPANEHRVLEIITMVRPVATVMVTSLTHPDLGLVHAISEVHPQVPQFVGLEHDSAVDDLPVVANVHRTRSFTGLLHEVLAVAARGRG